MRAPTAIRSFLVMMLALAGCSNPGASSEASPPIRRTSQALWVNGGFEASAIGTIPAGWTVTTHTNPGLTDLRPFPQTFASLNLQPGGTSATVVVGGATESQVEPALGAAASLRFPRFGTRAASVNYNPAGAIGNNNNANVMRQTMTVGVGDIDALDGRAHVRFLTAPVLENPGHTYAQQPYYFLEVRNLTQGTVLFQELNFSGEPGVPWKIANGVAYTDWRLVDVAPGTAGLALGDQVGIAIVAAGCSQSGHWGRVYVDEVGSIPGLYTWATGPQSANVGSDVRYTVNYRNGAGATATNAVLSFNTPPNTTFQSVDFPQGTCSTPAVGATGLVSCALGSLVAGATSNLTLTVRIAAGTAVGTVINAANYSIAASNSSALLGPKVQTNVTTAVVFADIAVTKTDGAAARDWGSATSYTITATNRGPGAAPSVTVVDVMPAQLTGVTWTCSGSGGGTCTASGAGHINDTAALPAGATVTYQVSANIIAGAGTGSVFNRARATPTGAVTDPTPADNDVADLTALGTVRTLSLTKTGATGGSVVSVPAAITCGPSCTSASGGFLDGSTLTLTASPVPFATFTGWGGACSGTAQTCTLTLTANTSVTAAFSPAPTIAVSGGGTQSTAAGSAFPSPLVVTVTDGTGTPLPGQVVTFTAPSSGASASLSGTTAVTDASGVASITATANVTAGSYLVTAAVPGSSATFSLTNATGPAASFTISSGQPQSTTVNTAFPVPLRVLVTDAVGNPIASRSVTFAAPGAGASASLGTTTVLTNASGIAGLSATANTTAGAYAVTASTAGLSDLTFSLTNTPGPATTATLDLGSPQSTLVGTTFASALELTVRDPYGNPVSGVAVTFSVPAGGASATLSSSAATTDTLGRVSITARANASPGSYVVGVLITGVTTPPAFSLTNTCPPGTAGNTCQYSDTVTCNAQGVAQADGSCVCAAGSAGTSCQFSDALTCNGHGAASANGSCTCATGFAGTRCTACAVNHFGYPICRFCDASTCGGNGTCTAQGLCDCPAGFGGPSCAACVAGYFCPAGSLSTRQTLCPEGSYCPAGAAAPTSCPAGTFGLSAGLATMACTGDCAAGTYSAIGATQCTPCATGTFNPDPRAAGCLSCGAGTFAAAAGMITCDACAPGSSSLPGQNVCSVCPAGTASVDGGVSCSTCPEGTFALPGSPTCSPCGAGTSSTAGAPSCTACQPGFSAGDAGLASCETCAPGTFASTAGAVACVSCGPGTFAEGAGSSACAPCLPGTFSTDGGSTCTSCASCSDDDACTTDRCDATLGCSHVAIAGCVPGDDGGVTPDDAGVNPDDAGTNPNDAGSNPNDAGMNEVPPPVGCGCTSAGATAGLMPLLALAGLVVLGRRARRQRAR